MTGEQRQKGSMYNEKVILEKLAGTIILVERRKRYVASLGGIQEKKGDLSFLS